MAKMCVFGFFTIKLKVCLLFFLNHGIKCMINYKMDVQIMDKVLLADFTQNYHIMQIHNLIHA